MNTRVGLALGTAFVLGIVAGYLGRGDSERADHAPVPSLRVASLAGASDTHQCGPLEKNANHEVEPQALGAEDPAMLFAAALAQPDSDAKSVALKRAFAQWLLAAPVQAMNSADRIPIEIREEVVAPALAQLAEAHPSQALGVLGSVRENYPRYAAAVLGAIAKSDSRRALDWAAQNMDRDPNGEVMRAIVSAVGPENLELVAPAVVAMGNRAPASLIQQVATEYAARDPKQAYAWARGLAQSRSHLAADQIVNGVSAAFAARSISEATAYLNEEVDPRIRASLLREIANRKSEADLREAWTWLSQYSAESSYPENARNLLYRWAYLRPEEVADILPNVADADLRNAVGRELSSQWQRRDSDAYQAWVGSLPAGPLKSAMLAGAQ